MVAIQIAVYILLLIFVVTVVSKMARYQKMPVHLRWELYPVAGETKRPWGGSYLEEPEWWKNPPEKHDLMGELKFMAEEIFFFKEYIHSNKSLWYIVWPFHMGVFAFAAFCGLIVVGAVTLQLDVAVASDSGAWGMLVYYVTLIAGIAALMLGTLGCLALLVRKLTDSTMAPYTRRVEYFNILLVLTVFVTGFASWAAYDAHFNTLREFMQTMIFFSDMPDVSTLTAIHILLLALLLAWVPFTNMTHFFAKHFTLNAVRWEDTPHLRGSDLERKIGPYLQQPVSWSAPHMQDIKMWTDVAKTSNEREVPGRRDITYEGGRSGFQKEDES